MKIGIITFHFALNQGAVLQCYALQKYLESCGHEVQIINYCPEYHTIVYAPVKNPFKYAEKCRKQFRDRKVIYQIYRAFRSFIKCLYINFKGIDKKNNACFASFINNNLNLTQRYLSLNQLKQNPPQLHAYISGSDQVWNPKLLDGQFDSAYFLDFGEQNVKRIAYAVSLGEKQDSTIYLGLKILCKELTAISLREYSESAIKFIDKKVHICLDPSLLLDAKDYKSIESSALRQEPYIFVYGFETNDEINAAVEFVKNKYGLHIINGSPKHIKLRVGAENVFVYGPDKFLTFIKNAQCVVTNSFHGTAFSVIYKREFITVPHSTRGVRMVDLLQKIGLTWRLWGNPDFAFEKEIDYAEVYTKLYEVRAESKKFLEDALK